MHATSISGLPSASRKQATWRARSVAFLGQCELLFLVELKRWLEEQLDTPGSGVSCVLSPYQLTIYYRGESVGSWRATREGARWHGKLDEDANTVVVRDVYDGIELTQRALFLFVRDLNSRGS